MDPLITSTGRTSLADISRQPLEVGMPPVLVFTKDGTRIDRDLINLSLQLRIANALEAQQELAQDAKHERFTEKEFNDGLNHLRATHAKESRTVKMDFLATSPAVAEEFVKNLAQVIEAAIEKAKEAAGE